MTNEIRLVWDIDIESVDYVHVDMAKCPRRAGRPKPPKIVEILQGTIVGWAELNPAFKPFVPREFVRRVFWLQDLDRGQPRDFGIYDDRCPAGAVDPRTLERGRPGYMTARAWGGFPIECEHAVHRQDLIETLLA